MLLCATMYKNWLAPQINRGAWQFQELQSELENVSGFTCQVFPNRVNVGALHVHLLHHSELDTKLTGHQCCNLQDWQIRNNSEKVKLKKNWNNSEKEKLKKEKEKSNYLLCRSRFLGSKLVARKTWMKSYARVSSWSSESWEINHHRMHHNS